YVSKNSVYLYGVSYLEQQTKGVIHKFSITDAQVNYVASGAVEGNFGNRNTQFRFSESGDYLRVISTIRDEDFKPLHQLTVFKSSAEHNKLALVSQLPNDSQPAKIGKVDEDIYAVRYFDNKAYVVTFQRTDPLYVIDLKDHENPFIAGALEIPGYSAYLHPISENLLLGIGQQIDPSRLPNVGDDATSSAPVIEEGAQVSLFDVSDPASPKKINTIVYVDGYSPVEFDYHALTYLKVSDDKHLFALPIETWSSKSNAQNDAVWSPHVTLQLLEVRLSGSSSELLKAGQINAVKPDGYSRFIGAWDDRSIIHDDDIYYIHGNHVLHSKWSDPQSITGPY
ncbi:MAG: beta-propeller domain-containing protein, partial [Psychrobium sp.]|nr:beta-propeller domain-containing protein [Psychrobium sp.]